MLNLREYRVTEGTFGRRIGCRLRELVEQRLRVASRAKDMVAPVTEEEFVVVLDRVAESEDLEAIAERLAARCAGIYVVEGFRLQITVRIGIASYPSDALEPGDLFRRARLALHVTDPQHTRPYQLYSSDLLERLRERVWLAAELDEALVQQRLVLHYQPLFEVETQKTVGAEALLRLRTSAGDLISPGRFIPLAESMGLIAIASTPCVSKVSTWLS